MWTFVNFFYNLSVLRIIVSNVSNTLHNFGKLSVNFNSIISVIAFLSHALIDTEPTLHFIFIILSIDDREGRKEIRECFMIQLPLGRSVSEDMKSGRLLLRGCTSILLKPFTTSPEVPNHRSEVFQAHVEDKCNYTIYARLSKRCVQRLMLKSDTTTKMYVQFVLSRLPFCKWHRAVDCLPDTSLVFPSPEFELSSRLPPLLHSEKDWHNLLDVRLNPKQVEAVTTMVAPTEIILPPILLLGPYGTGKTFTIAQALLIMLMENPRNKVLLCTQSNSAADLYVKEFFDEWYTSTSNERLKPMRIYYSRRLRNTVRIRSHNI